MISISAHDPKPNAFSGAKLLLFVGPDLVVMLRDDRPDIPFPGCWDLPGGGREGQESPVACVLRETREEVDLSLGADDLVWGREFAGTVDATWMFAAHPPETSANILTLGHEGQALRLMAPSEYLTHPKHVPHFAARLQLYLAEAESFS